MSSIKLSVIIPAYKEEGSIVQTIRSLRDELDTYPYQKEIVVVVDGSPDRTYERALSVACPYLRVLTYQPNRGKGYAIYYGARHSRGKVVTFFDAGGDFSPDHIDRYVKLLEAFSADIVIGSKRHPASRINYPRSRRLLSWGWQLLIRILFRLSVTDTQTGLKVLRREVLEKIVPRAAVKRYAFDLELLVIAQKLGFRRIFEAPVDMNFNAVGGGAGSLKSIWRMFVDMLGIWYRLRILHYYDRPHYRLQ